jgi:hypothetical protein
LIWYATFSRDAKTTWGGGSKAERGCGAGLPAKVRLAHLSVFSAFLLVFFSSFSPSSKPKKYPITGECGISD